MEENKLNPRLSMQSIQTQTTEQLRPEELKRLGDFFSLLIKIDLRQKCKDVVCNQIEPLTHQSQK